MACCANKSATPHSFLFPIHASRGRTRSRTHTTCGRVRTRGPARRRLNQRKLLRQYFAPPGGLKAVGGVVPHEMIAARSEEADERDRRRTGPQEARATPGRVRPRSVSASGFTAPSIPPGGVDINHQAGSPRPPAPQPPWGHVGAPGTPCLPAPRPHRGPEARGRADPRSLLALPRH